MYDIILNRPGQRSGNIFLSLTWMENHSTKRQRSIVYQRAKNEKQTVAFGMHANPISLSKEDLRVCIGNHSCKQPYYASIYNIGAMSYGALGKTAIEALKRPHSTTTI